MAQPLAHVPRPDKSAGPPSPPAPFFNHLSSPPQNVRPLTSRPFSWPHMLRQKDTYPDDRPHRGRGPCQACCAADAAVVAGLGKTSNFCPRQRNHSSLNCVKPTAPSQGLCCSIASAVIACVQLSGQILQSGHAPARRARGLFRQTQTCRVYGKVCLGHVAVEKIGRSVVREGCFFRGGGSANRVCPSNICVLAIFFCQRVVPDATKPGFGRGGDAAAVFGHA